jgi:hypothetical protein
MYSPTISRRLRDAADADRRLMFFAVPGRNPAWASPPSGEAGPGSAVLVATGLLAGAERGRLLAPSGRFILLDISLFDRCWSFAAALRRCPQREADQLTGGLLASRPGETRHSSRCLRGISADECCGGLSIPRNFS